MLELFPDSRPLCFRISEIRWNLEPNRDFCVASSGSITALYFSYPSGKFHPPASAYGVAAT